MTNYLITYLYNDAEKIITIPASSYDELMNIINFDNVIEENSIILSIEKK